MKRISQKTKKIRKMGQGTGESYIAGISTREFSSHSTRSDYPHPYMGRNVSLMSSGERDFFLHLLWNETNAVDIQEQYPLPVEQTALLCSSMGIRHPKDNTEGVLIPFTTDFLVTYDDGSRKAYSIKYSSKDLDNLRTLEKLCIEKLYWKENHVAFQLVYRDTDINRTEATNLRLIYSRYNSSEINTEFDLILYLLAHRKIPAGDLKLKPLNLQSLKDQYLPDKAAFQKLLEETGKETE